MLTKDEGRRQKDDPRFAEHWFAFLHPSSFILHPSSFILAGQ